MFGGGKQVRDDQIGLAAKTTLNQVRDLIAPGDWQQAQDKLVAVSDAGGRDRRCRAEAGVARSVQRPVGQRWSNAIRRPPRRPAWCTPSRRHRRRWCRRSSRPAPPSPSLTTSATPTTSVPPTTSETPASGHHLGQRFGGLDHPDLRSPASSSAASSPESATTSPAPRWPDAHGPVRRRRPGRDAPPPRPHRCSRARRHRRHHG